MTHPVDYYKKIIQNTYQKGIILRLVVKNIFRLNANYKDRRIEACFSE